ncbi:hypothetical protein [Faecalispora jeddahensis]|uniref:hypothetical protein n=1 Tax=Faecalispora jeddahensis TaxID=1414721 RepID=UPI0027BA4291|nr:hypothetical protein [Faecalispora jeddahensis]
MNYFTTDQQRQLLEFIADCENNAGRKPLRVHLTAELFQQVLDGQREIGDIATDHKTGDVYVRFCFTKEATNE